MKDEPFDLTDPSYTPVKLLDEAKWVLRARNRSQLARVLEIDEAIICRVWNLKVPISDHLMVQIADRTGWSIQYVRQLAGTPYDGAVFPPRPRLISLPKNPLDRYHIAKGHIVQSMPGTVPQLAKKSGYSANTVRFWVNEMRQGDPLTRASHITGWLPPPKSGAHLPIHAAGPGEDAVRILLPRPSRRRPAHLVLAAQLLATHDL